MLDITLNRLNIKLIDAGRGTIVLPLIVILVLIQMNSGILRCNTHNYN